MNQPLQIIPSPMKGENFSEDALSSERYHLAIQTLKTAISDYFSHPSPEAAKFRERQLEAMSRYLKLRFPSPANSFHLGPGDSHLPILEALTGCQVVIAEVSEQAVSYQTNLKKLLDKQLAQAGGSITILSESGNIQLETCENYYDHITALNVFNQIPVSQGLESMKLILKSLKDSGSLCLETEIGYNETPTSRSLQLYKRRNSPQEVIDKAADGYSLAYLLINNNPDYSVSSDEDCSGPLSPIGTSSRILTVSK